MTTRALRNTKEYLPVVFEDFFKPWNEWFQPTEFVNGLMTVPAVNVTETKDDYQVKVAAPGLKKEDFKVDVEGNILTISSEKEETKNEKDEKYSRKEYTYSSFSRSFTLPDVVHRDKIDAKYENGILSLSLPKREEAKKPTISKLIEVH
ncbi:MAG: Hsp20/alpha crystallin family protein [Saprospiraceae bacterium]